MYSVTSGAVYSALNNFIKYKDVQINFADLSWVTYPQGGFYANTPISSYMPTYDKIISLTTIVWGYIDCRGFYVGLDEEATKISFVVETHPSNAFVKLRIFYI